MAFPTVTEVGYDYTVGSFEVVISASESFFYGPSQLLVSIHSDSLPLLTINNCSAWNGVPMTLAQCNEVLTEAGITSVVRNQVANQLLMEYTHSWFPGDAEFVEYGLCPDITVDVHFIEDSESDIGSDSSSEFDMSSDSDMDVDHPDPPATITEHSDSLQEIYHLEQDGEKCIICLDLMLASMPVLATPCGHFFHPECLRNWRTVQAICPLCRSAI